MSESKTSARPGVPPKAPFVDTEPAGEDWRVRKACRDMDPEAFFEDGRSPAALAAVEGARAVCSGCPVRRECGNYAVDREFTAAHIMRDALEAAIADLGPNLTLVHGAAKGADELADACAAPRRPASA